MTLQEFFKPMQHNIDALPPDAKEELGVALVNFYENCLAEKVPKKHIAPSMIGFATGFMTAANWQNKKIKNN